MQCRRHVVSFALPRLSIARVLHEQTQLHTIRVRVPGRVPVGIILYITAGQCCTRTSTACNVVPQQTSRIRDEGHVPSIYVLSTAAQLPSQSKGRAREVQDLRITNARHEVGDGGQWADTKKIYSWLHARKPSQPPPPAIPPAAIDLKDVLSSSRTYLRWVSRNSL